LKERISSVVQPTQPIPVSPLDSELCMTSPLGIDVPVDVFSRNGMSWMPSMNSGRSRERDDEERSSIEESARGRDDNMEIL
jgi:hypothetical protein